MQKTIINQIFVQIKTYIWIEYILIRQIYIDIIVKYVIYQLNIRIIVITRFAISYFKICVKWFQFLQYKISSFDTTSPLIRAFKDKKKNYYSLQSGKISYFTAIRVPQATKNNRFIRAAKEGKINPFDAYPEDDRQIQSKCNRRIYKGGSRKSTRKAAAIKIQAVQRGKKGREKSCNKRPLCKYSGKTCKLILGGKSYWSERPLKDLFVEMLTDDIYYGGLKAVKILNKEIKAVDSRLSSIYKSSDKEIILTPIDTRDENELKKIFRNVDNPNYRSAYSYSGGKRHQKRTHKKKQGRRTIRKKKQARTHKKKKEDRTHKRNRKRRTGYRKQKRRTGYRKQKRRTKK